jgi:arsenite-transporting ATPase
MAEEEELSMAEPTIVNVLEQKELKWIFVGGKGGVGKTTCSCMLAVLLARVRKSVLLISTDPAHNLSDAFSQKFTKTPTPVQGFSNLFAMEVDPTVESDNLEQMEGMGSFVSELANAIPGVDEAMSFAEMLKLVQNMDYSVIVFDTAPTGHTLRLLQFPSTLEKGLGKMMSLRNKFGGLINQVSRMFGAGEEFGENALMGKLEGIKSVIEQVSTSSRKPLYPSNQPMEHRKRETVCMKSKVSVWYKRCSLILSHQFASIVLLSSTLRNWRFSLLKVRVLYKIYSLSHQFAVMVFISSTLRN